MNAPSYRSQRRDGGFSLVEVMVALIVTSIGLLGLAKMESLALSSTGVAGTRSIAAIQAASLASAMKSNGAFWAAGFAPAVTTVSIASNKAVTVASNPDVGLGTLPDCTGASCTPAQMAAYDLAKWGAALTQPPLQLQAFLGTITCSTTGFPVTCTIQMQWLENAVAMNGNQADAASMAALQATAPYILYVQP